MTISWIEKLRRLQEQLELTSEGMASALGITTRTLSDFMKPISEGGREPSQPIQRLIDLLLGELIPKVEKSHLNLVIIHGDFRIFDDMEATVNAIVEMHSTVSGKQQSEKNIYPKIPSLRNNEFHYVIASPERDVKFALDALARRRIQPHFFAAPEELISPEAQDCYFSATAVWLASQALRKDLSHITLAADAKKFWPLAKELKELLEVEVTFILDKNDGLDQNIKKALKEIGIAFADPAGRKIGKVEKLEDGFGFISQETPWGLGETGKAGIFFSWNHMRKNQWGSDEIPLKDLKKGDTVSFSIGMNHKGSCAIDVALVDRVHEATQPINHSSASKEEISQLIDQIKDAIAVCAGADGWALLAQVGTRISVLDPNFKEKNIALASFVENHSDIFEYTNKNESAKGAATVRLRT